MDIPKRLRPLRPTQIVDDASFQGAHETNLSRQTAAYALRACGNVAHYTYHSVYAAPQAFVSSKGSWETFSFAADYPVDFEVPWHHQSQHTAIGAQLRVVSQTNGLALARLQSDQLIDAVATTKADGVYAVTTDRSGNYGWNRTQGNIAFAGETYPGSSWRVATYRLRLDSPTLPANRRIALRPQLRINAIHDMFIAVVSAKFYIESLVVWDEPDPDTNA